MGDVVKLRRPRNGTIRGGARQAFGDAMRHIKAPTAVVVVVIGADGNVALRSANYIDDIKDFDMYARASAVIARQANSLLDME